MDTTGGRDNAGTGKGVDSSWNSVLGTPGRIDVGGHELAYYSRGSGEAVVLVHGITTYSFIWRRVVPLLADDYRVITLDLLGCGDSDCPLDVSYSLKNHASLVSEFVAKLGIEQYHLVGHDVGGGIAQLVAVRSPESLLDLTLINTVAYDFWPVQPIIAIRTPILRQLAMATLDFGTFKLIVRRGMHHKKKVTLELMDLFWRPMMRRAGRKAFLHFARCLDNRNLLEIEEALRKLTFPVLVVRGDADVYLSSAIAARLHEEIPGSELATIPTAGHFIQEDEPEILAELMLRFLSGRQSG